MGSDTSRLQELFPELQAAFESGLSREAAAAASCGQTAVPSEAASNATSAQAVTVKVQDKDSCVDALTEAVSEQLCVSGRAVVPVMPAAAQSQPGLMPTASNRCATQCMAHLAAAQSDSCSPAGAAAGIEQLPKLGRHLAAPSVAELTAAATARQQGSSASDFAEPFCQDGGEYAALENMVSTSDASCR
jgi:hypothetical protein